MHYIPAALTAAILAALASAEPAAPAAHATCRSSSHPDDSSTAACFGWCSPPFADEHCTWCRCRGCAFCEAAARASPNAEGFAQLLDGPSPGKLSAPGVGVAAATSVALSAVVQPSVDGTASAAAGCHSDVADDVSYRDCQPFCNVLYRDAHCTTCKCAACSFCSCKSSIADDSPDERCEPWCSSEFEDHCEVRPPRHARERQQLAWASNS